MKIVLQAPSLATEKTETVKQSSLSEVIKEKWFGTKYKKFEKPKNLEETVSAEEWARIKAMMHQPRKNPYIPEKTICLTQES